MTDPDRPLRHLNALAAAHAESGLLLAYADEVKAGRLSAAKAEALFRQDLADLTEPETTR